VATRGATVRLPPRCPAPGRSPSVGVAGARCCFWVEFLRSLKKRGLAGVKLAASDQHEGLKAAIERVLGCSWQRCTVHFVRDMLAHCRRDQRGLVSAALRGEGVNGFYVVSPSGTKITKSPTTKKKPPSTTPGY
jgi:hypothetical protein